MSLVPSLSCGRSRRDGLNSLRNTFSFLSILVVYGFAVDIDKFTENIMNDNIITQRELMKAIISFELYDTSKNIFCNKKWNKFANKVLKSINEYKVSTTYASRNRKFNQNGA